MLHTESAARPDCRVSVSCFPLDQRPSHVSILESMFAVVSLLSKGECIIRASKLKWAVFSNKVRGFTGRPLHR